ncbi:Uncharacterized protein OS=Rickettsia bellii (strain RML369-C) GN=RBE_0110 PE=4 SV=1: LRR_6: LRR_6: LRR_6 [Gemmataceae bacterium]|nr:Uncharacterized protein OS=Rickettsia bellii (strain RML369-C) GN=RBE_0110 PE=4 SV=1: LRR_6: LRR_6: LRR_6 [Gemmataceae bacterium]VTU01083.1 Uncharacterized protein OS=Rickettsia bellii (strain RML369-C) GN=RBE_0110 PE=4 SV=1: LRR_6: LRR_6: LRR_6 [Gemmataceae bacterium]
MTEREALLAAVCKAPADDTPRLVFADWLDETGDPADAKRAAYIRAAVAQWRLEDAGTPAALVHAFLDDRRFLSGDRALLDPVDWAAVDPDVGAIYAADRARRAVRLPRAALAAGLPVVKGVTFDREDVGGFYNEVAVRDPAAFLAHAAAIYRAAPIYFLSFRGSRRVTAEFTRDFVAAGHLARTQWLAFDDIEPEAMRVLGDHPDAAGVELLEIDVSEDELVEQFVAGPHWTGLTDLYVRRFWDGGDAVSALVPLCPRFRGLRHLSIIGDMVGDETARAIATGGLTELQNLDLRFSHVSSDGAAALAGSSKLPNLRYLDLEDCGRVGAEGVSRLLVSPKLKNLLALRAARCGSDGVLLDPKALTGPGRGPRLRALELDSTRTIGPRALAALAACPAAQGLWFLSLADCEVTDTGLRGLARSAGLRELAVLDVSQNQLTDAAAQVIADWPVPLQGINLMQNPIGAAGAKALIKSPHRQGLKRVLIEGRGRPHLRTHFGKRVVP